MQKNFDEEMMALAINAARNAQGRTSPNPMVGAVVVRDNRVVAIGWHREAGTPHAEIHALNMAGALAKGATVYVSLEPCAHHGRTGPCAEALIKAGVARVVVALEDPNPKVAGRGISLLRNAGIQVDVGILRSEAQVLNEVFFKWITTGRPFVTVKYAMSLDGKIATASGESQWISNELSRLKTHYYRDCFDGIMVGINTVLKDNPSLTTRLPEGQGKNPVRIVVDSQCRIPITANLIQDGLARTIVAVTESAPAEKVSALEKCGIQVIRAGQGEKVDLPLLMDELGKEKITSILAEGGGQLHFSLLKQGIVDKVYAFIAPKILGGSEALSPVEGEGFSSLKEATELFNVEYKQLGEDILVTGYVKRDRQVMK